MASQTSTTTIITFIVSFIVLAIYWGIQKPDFVTEIDKTKNIPVLSINLLTIYSLLYSSVIGLLIMAICIIFEK
jgi:uncharacterized membrane protein